jgi:hypothetical protein
VTGVAVGALLPPVKVQTMRSMWLRPGVSGTLEPAFGEGGNRALRLVGLLVLAAAFVAMYSIGMGVWG